MHNSTSCTPLEISQLVELEYVVSVEYDLRKKIMAFKRVFNWRKKKKKKKQVWHTFGVSIEKQDKRLWNPGGLADLASREKPE